MWKSAPQKDTVKNKTLPLQNSLRFSSITLHGRDKTLKSKYATDVGLYVLSDRIKSLHGRVFVLLSRVKTLCTSEEAFIIRAPSIRIGITDTKQTILVDSKNLRRNQVFSTKQKDLCDWVYMKIQSSAMIKNCVIGFEKIDSLKWINSNF